MPKRLPRESQLSLDLVSSRAPLKAAGPRRTAVKSCLIPTPVFDTYWRFAAERQKIFFSKAIGKPGPWTTDPILSRYRFTNAYRASDRVSQYLIAKIQYQGPQDPNALFFRTLLFKIFNKIETWELLERAFGTVYPHEGMEREYSKILEDAMVRGDRIYSAAYIMPSGSGAFTFARKYQAHLALLAHMMKEQVPDRLRECKTMQQAFSLIRSYPTFGDFLAYQYVTDLNYSMLTTFDESEFVMPGPGALSGIQKCFHNIGSYTQSDVIRWMTDHQEEEFRARGLEFQTLWGRPLQLIDCQNLFCEVDKYSRVFHPDIPGAFGRTRIKQEYKQNTEPLTYWFPPKWGLNSACTS
jgi:hypothetical protein